MYAVIKTGGKQYRVAPGDEIKVELLAGAAGDAVTFGEVLVMGHGEDAAIGKPTIPGATVTAEIVDQVRTRKIIVFKKRRRQNSKRRNGHRQHLTVVRITDIQANA